MATTPGADDKGRFKRRIIPIIAVLIVVAVSVGLFIFTRQYPDKVEAFSNYGYIGVFLGNLISSLTVILPVPGFLMFLPLLVTLNPVLVALVGATGGIIGEIAGYVAGYGGQAAMSKGRTYQRVEGWMKRWGGWTIFVFASAPFLLFDVAGLVAGALRYPLWKFMLFGWLGKVLKYIGLVYAALWGWETLLGFLG